MIADGSALVTGLLLAMNVPVQALLVPVIGVTILVVKQHQLAVLARTYEPSACRKMFPLISSRVMTTSLPGSRTLRIPLSGAPPPQQKQEKAVNLHVP